MKSLLGVAVLPQYPPANFQTLALSGSVADFFPSTFVAYNEALDKGMAFAAMDSQKTTVVEVANETRAAHKNPAKAFFVRDAHGNAVLIKEKS